MPVTYDSVGLEQLLRACTVQIVGPDGTFAGSGFFVGPNSVVTAAHVLAGVRDEVFVVLADGKKVGPVTIAKIEPYWPTREGVFELPDLALLSLSEDDAPKHPCVQLGTCTRSPDMFAEGYSSGATIDVAADSTRLRFETFRTEPGGSLISVADGLITDGQSGGPLLECATGRVVGIVKARRGREGPMGGVAVSATEIRERWPDVWLANEEFHRVDRRWVFARDGGGDADLVGVTADVLRAIIARSDMRSSLLPSDVEPDRIHQPPWVYPLSGNELASDTEITRVRSTTPKAVDEASPTPEAAFKWNPLRSPWPAVVVHGLPGYGKSWLLRTHTTSVARNSLTRLEQEDGIFAAVQVPLLITCPAFAQALRHTPDSPVEAVIEAFVNDMDNTSDVHSDQAAAVIRVAHQAGLLIVCLDGFDELPSSSKEPVKQALTALTEGRNQVVLSSRPDAGLTADLKIVLKEPLHVRVTGFAPSQITSFIEGWFERAPQKALALKAKLVESPELRILARVPLLSSFLCLLTHEAEVSDVEDLPTSQNAVYQAVLLGMLSGRWRDNAAQQAFDPISPPDAAMRLASLATAIGQITDEWRARTERFVRGDLEDALRETPRYARLRVNAEARWNAYCDLRRASNLKPPGDHVMWEYLFDGLLVADTRRSDRPGVRFAHPILGEYCAAVYLSDLPAERMYSMLGKHRWFDPAWREVFPAVAERVKDVDALLSWLLVDDDPWNEQTLIAARCLAAAHRGANPASPRSREAVVDRVCGMLGSLRIFDWNRGVEALAALVRSKVPEAVSRARAAAMDEDTPALVRLSLIAALTERGDASGLSLTKANIHNQGLTGSARIALARAFILSGADDAVAGVMGFIRSVGPADQADIVAGIPVEAPGGLALVLGVLRQQDLQPAPRIRAGQALLNLGGAEVAHVRAVVADAFGDVNVRAPLLAELITGGADDLVPLGLRMKSDPNLTTVRLVPLVHALLRCGELAVVDTARDILTNNNVAWTDRAVTARLLAELGEIGIRVLRDQLSVGWISIGYKVRNFIELIRAEQSQEIEQARSLVLTTGYPTWVRCRLATALIQNKVSLDRETLDAVVTLATAPNEDSDVFQVELLVALASAHVDEAVAAVAEFLTRLDRGHDTWMSLCTGLAASGATGQRAVGEVSRATALRVEGRMIAVIAMAGVSSIKAAKLAAPILEERIPGYLRSAFVIHLAQRGVIEMADELLGLVDSTQTCYSALHDALSSARAEADLVESCLGVVSGAAEMTMRRDSLPDDEIRVDADWLKAAGVTWSSDADRGRKLQFVNSLLTKRVWSRLRWVLAPTRGHQNRESVEEAMQSLIQDCMPEVRALEIERLSEDLRRDRVQLPVLVPDDTTTPLQHLSALAEVLDQWVNKTVARKIAESVQFLHENREVILCAEARALLTFAASMVSTWPPYEGHVYVVSYGMARGADAAIHLLGNVSEVGELEKDHLGALEGTQLYNAAGLGVLLEPRSAVHWFYAGLGAAMVGKHGFAVRLMARSHGLASVRQRTQGLRTIKTTGERAKWPNDLVDVLCKALAGDSSDEQDADSSSDDGELQNHHEGAETKRDDFGETNQQTA